MATFGCGYVPSALVLLKAGMDLPLHRSVVMLLWIQNQSQRTIPGSLSLKLSSKYVPDVWIPAPAMDARLSLGLSVRRQAAEGQRQLRTLHIFHPTSCMVTGHNSHHFLQ